MGKNKVTIPPKARIRVIWEDLPENYTKEKQKRVNTYFVEKYGNPNVQVIFKPKKVNVEGSEVEMTVADNVMDINYQRKLFKEWLNVNNIDVDWDRLLTLDGKVNEKLSQERDIDYRYRNWFIRELEWDNFLSFGDGNKLNFDGLDGITVVDSVPENMGGKCLLGETRVDIIVDTDYITNLIGFIPVELGIEPIQGVVNINLRLINDLYQKYGNLGFKVNTPYGYKKIIASDITAKDSNVIEITMDNGISLGGSPKHRIKTSTGKFIELGKVRINQKIQTIYGVNKIKNIKLLPFTTDLYDIEVDEVNQYYSNGIVSHNSSMAIDLLLFLFFNTTTKGTTAIKMFNKYRDKDEVRVKGRVSIDGVDYIIERIITRKGKKNSDEYTTRTDLNFYRMLPDGTIENLEGEQRRETDDLIKKSIGSVDDFLLTIIADADNLENIIKSKPTEKGRVLSRFIGLEILEDKETICKEMKSTWSKGLKSDQYNTVELKNGVDKYLNDIDLEENSIKENTTKVQEITELIKTTTEIKEGIILQKTKIDDSVINLRPGDIDRLIEDITTKGQKTKERLDQLKLEFKSMVDVEYNETEHNKSIKEDRDFRVKESTINSTIKTTEKLIKDLQEGEFCPTCKQPLKDVDHTEEIEQNKLKLIELGEELKQTKENIVSIGVILENHVKIKKQADDYYKHSIMIDKIEMELDNMRLQLKEQKGLKDKYNENIENIEKNKGLDTKIVGYNSRINTLESDKLNLDRTIQRSLSNIETYRTNISKNKELIETIKIEEEVRVIFDTYIKMLGKNGIVKMIMKSVIPLINSELDRLLNGVVDFRLTVNVNDKNEVEFLLNRSGGDIDYPIQEGSGLEKTISSLALRFVMSRISPLPKPNIITLDEVLGKVANVNLEPMGEFFQKANEMFPSIFIITHNPLVKDWAKNIITVTKIDNVSSISKK